MTNQVEDAPWHQDQDGHFRFAKPATEEDVLALAASILERRLAHRVPIGDNKEAKQYFQIRLAHLEHEVFCALFLDSKHRIICFRQLFRGTIDSCSVPIREVVVEALNHNAAAVIFAHNHPSGDVEPSAGDRKLTESLAFALDLVGVRVLDHIVVGSEGTYSFAEHHLLS